MMSDYLPGDVAVDACDGAGGYCVAVVVAVGDEVVDDGLSLITVRRAAVAAATAFECSTGVLCLLMTTDAVDVDHGGCHWFGIDWSEPSGKMRRTIPRKTDEITETLERRHQWSWVAFASYIRSDGVDSGSSAVASAPESLCPSVREPATGSF